MDGAECGPGAHLDVKRTPLELEEFARLAVEDKRTVPVLDPRAPPKAVVVLDVFHVPGVVAG
jgi:hypothetical protein